MGSAPLIIAIVVLLLLVVLGGIYFGVFSSKASSGLGSSSGLRTSGRTMSQSGFSNEPPSGAPGRRKPVGSILESAAATANSSNSRSKLTLEKKIKYAQLTISPKAFRLAEIVVSLIAMGLISLKCNLVVVAVAGLTGPIFLGGLLNWAVDRRMKAFDADYPQFLMSVVGLLKTGMNALGALEAAAQGLNEESLLRHETEMMIERLRFGVPEEKSIGAFGEDIFHPEIELFVQALILSMRVGGTLSDTLERLAKQVRKRQFFRSSANAAVGLQRGSIYFIIAILAGLEIYLSFTYPEAVWGAIADPVGWQVWQAAILVILLGIYWVRQVTKLKV